MDFRRLVVRHQQQEWKTATERARHHCDKDGNYKSCHDGHKAESVVGHLV
jgi:hypothetical protein